MNLRSRVSDYIEENTDLIGYEGSGEQWWMKQKGLNQEDYSVVGNGIEYGFEITDDERIGVTVQCINRKEVSDNMLEGYKKDLKDDVIRYHPELSRGKLTYPNGLLQITFNNKKEVVDFIKQIRTMVLVSTHFRFPELIKEEDRKVEVEVEILEKIKNHE
jgi:hypothetical protein